MLDELRRRLGQCRCPRQQPEIDFQFGALAGVICELEHFTLDFGAQAEQSAHRAQHATGLPLERLLEARPRFLPEDIAAEREGLFPLVSGLDHVREQLFAVAEVAVAQQKQLPEGVVELGIDSAEAIEGPARGLTVQRSGIFDWLQSATQPCPQRHPMGHAET